MVGLRILALPVLGGLVLAVVAAGLGNWQMHRAEQKQQLQQQTDRLALEPPVELGGDRVDARDLAWRRVHVQGVWRPENAVFLDNRIYRGRPGYEVLMPLAIGDGRLHVLVDRGWVAAGTRREDLPVIRTPGGSVEIVGQARDHLPKYLELSSAPPSGRIWQQVALPEFAAWSGLALQPVLVLQTNVADDGLVRDWPRPDLGIDRHRGYAFQWFSLAGLAVVLMLVFGFKRRVEP